MPYGLKLFLYISAWFLAGVAVGFSLSNPNIFTAFGIALLMGLAMLLIGRRVFGRRGLFR